MSVPLSRPKRSAKRALTAPTARLACISRERWLIFRQKKIPVSVAKKEARKISVEPSSMKEKSRLTTKARRIASVGPAKIARMSGAKAVGDK
jgi:hypothetical protein